MSVCVEMPNSLLYKNFLMFKFGETLVMKNTIQYIVDDRGVKTSVIVPFDEWEKMNLDYRKLQNKLKVFHSISEGIGEIKEAKKQGNKLQTLSEFLNESHS